MRIHRSLRHSLAIAICFTFGAGSAIAGPCKAILAPDAENDAQHSFAATVVSIDGNAVVTYAHDYMTYHPKGERGAGAEPFGGTAGWWASTGWDGPNGGLTAQLFSNRFTGVGDDTQPFALSRKDLIDLAITNEDAPHVRITLRSWGNVKINFVADCGPDGMLHGMIAPRSDPVMRRESAATSFIILFRRAVCAVCG